MASKPSSTFKSSILRLHVTTSPFSLCSGVPKPSYRALQLLAGFPRVGVPVDADANGTPRRSGLGPAGTCTATVGTVDVITGVDFSQGTTIRISALFANWNFNVNDATNPSTGLPIETASGVVLSFAGLPKGAIIPSNATFTLLDSTHGWARPAWVAAGSPLYPSAADIDAELAASQLVPQPIPILEGGSPGVVSVTIPDLEPYATALLVVEYGVPASESV